MKGRGVTSRTETQRYRGAQRIYSTNILWQIPLLLLTITIASAGTKNTEPAASQPFPQRGYQIFPQGISSVQGTVKQFPSCSSAPASSERWDATRMITKTSCFLIIPLCKAGLSCRLCFLCAALSIVLSKSIPQFDMVAPYAFALALPVSLGLHLALSAQGQRSISSPCARRSPRPSLLYFSSLFVR